MTKFFDQIPLQRWNELAQADRVMLVGVSGSSYTNQNPLPVSVTGGINLSGTTISIDKVKIEEVPPTDILSNNPAFIINYDSSNKMVSLKNIIKGITYIKTFAYDSAGNLISGTAWI